jgi:hypothetical protein
MRKSGIAAAFVLAAAGLWAYTPPSGGQSLFLLGHPKFVTLANSAAGGALFSEGSYSLNFNPALTAGLQCPSADFGYTGLQEFDDPNKHGASLHLGFSYPSRFGVFSLGAQGNFVKLSDAPIGNVGLLRLGLARDVTENLYLGFSLSGGGLGYDGVSDFYVAGDIGAWYRVPQIAFLKEVRFAVALQNIGKPFQTSGPLKVENSTGFPGVFAPKAGVAAHLIDIKERQFALGVSADVAFPTFTNFLLNAGLQIAIARFVYVSAGWDFNAREVADGGGNALHLPFVGVGVRLSLNTSGNEMMKRRGFNETTLDVDGAWQGQQGSLHLISIGAAASFGVKDVLPPDISTGEVRHNQ